MVKGRRTPTERISRIARLLEGRTPAAERLLDVFRAILLLRGARRGQTVRVTRSQAGNAPRSTHSKRKRNPGAYRRRRARRRRLQQVALRSATCWENRTGGIVVINSRKGRR